MSKTVDLLGQQAEYYLNHTCKTIDKKLIEMFLDPDVIDKIFQCFSDRNLQYPLIACNLFLYMESYNAGYVSILRVDQDIEVQPDIVSLNANY